MSANDSIMKYSAAGIQQLASELTTYYQQLTGQQNDADTTATNLSNNWDGGGKDAFMTQHGKLMNDLGNVISILGGSNGQGGGVGGVNAALHNAQIADGKVAASF